MKKFIILAAIILITSYFNGLAVPPPDGQAGYTGPWNADDAVSKQETNDYSFDNALGEYRLFVICEIDINNVTGNIYLGWLNPDGGKDLEGYNMLFHITGGNGWAFEASGSIGESTNSTEHIAYAINETTNLPVRTVFLGGSKWFFTNNVGSWNQVGTTQKFICNKFSLSGQPGFFKDANTKEDVAGPQPGDTYGPEGSSNDYDDKSDINGFWNLYQVEYSRQCSNACWGNGWFKLNPGTVWASPEAEEGFYIFPVYIEVDYLTFKDAANTYQFSGNSAVNDPGNYTKTP